MNQENMIIGFMRKLDLIDMVNMIDKELIKYVFDVLFEAAWYYKIYNNVI